MARIYPYNFFDGMSEEGMVAEEMRRHHMTVDELDDTYWKEDRSEEDT